MLWTLPVLLGGLLPARAEPADRDGDGVADLYEDLDGDGDLLEHDTDDDGTPNVEDPDDDGDGIPTAEEDFDGNGDPRNDDLDGFGVPDWLDEDTPKDVDRDTYISDAYGGDDCDDSRFGVNPGIDHDPLYDGEDWNCDDPTGLLDFDGDRDGYLDAREYEGGEDCNDRDPLVHPGAEEVAGDDLDSDCDGWTDPTWPLTSRGGCDCASAPAGGRARLAWSGLTLSGLAGLALWLGRRRP